MWGRVGRAECVGSECSGCTREVAEVGLGHSVSKKRAPGGLGQGSGMPPWGMGRATLAAG